MQPDLFGATPQPEQITAGVDEAGRGPLAGAVYAAAVILDPARPIEGLADSKALKPARREALALEIRERALAWFIASASVQEIDSLNILRATMLAMQRAVQGLSVAPQLALVDGNQAPAGLHGADRDQGRRPGAGDLGRVHPGQDRPRRGPAAPARAISAICLRSAQGLRHGAAPRLLREHGPCAEHRRSFAPIKAFGADA